MRKELEKDIEDVKAELEEMRQSLWAFRDDAGTDEYRSSYYAYYNYLRGLLRAKELLDGRTG